MIINHLQSTSDMEHTSILIAHTSTHTQENTQTRVNKKFQSPATSDFPKTTNILMKYVYEIT